MNRWVGREVEGRILRAQQGVGAGEWMGRWLWSGRRMGVVKAGLTGAALSALEQPQGQTCSHRLLSLR